jgi:transcriptional regulator with XRE-family HTH domain
MNNLIGNRIKVLMALNNLGPDSIVKLSGLNKFQLENILQGKSKKIDLLLKISKALNVSLDLICDIESKPSSINNNKLLSYELPLCTELLSSQYSVKLGKQLRQSIISVITSNASATDTYKELIQRIQGIIILLKEYPELVGKLDSKI